MSKKSKSAIKSTPKRANTNKQSTKNEPQQKGKREFKIGLVFAIVATLANIGIYIFSIIPTYNALESSESSTASISDTLDKSENIVNILMPVIYISLLAAVVFVATGIVKHVGSKPKDKSRSTSTSNT